MAWFIAITSNFFVRSVTSSLYLLVQFKNIGIFLYLRQLSVFFEFLIYSFHYNPSLARVLRVSSLRCLTSPKGAIEASCINLASILTFFVR